MNVSYMLLNALRELHTQQKAHKCVDCEMSCAINRSPIYGPHVGTGLNPISDTMSYNKIISTPM